MKRLLLVLLLTGMILSFGGCGANEPADLRDLAWFDDFLTGKNETELTLDEYPGVVFRYSTKEGRAAAKPEEGEEHFFFEGMCVKNIFLSDLNGDGYREFCATYSLGSGIIHYWVTVYDYHAGEKYDLLGYDLSDRSEYDYILELREGKLKAVKYKNESGGAQTEPLMAGTLALEEQDGKTVLLLKET